MQKKILVADDEPRMRKLVVDYLQKDGYLVVEAKDGEEALQQFYKIKDIDLFILDIMMPILDGLEVCKEIRAFSDVPIFLLTAKSEENDVLMGYECGADEYIAKPFSPRILVAKVNAVFRKENEKNNDSLHYLSKGHIYVDITGHRVLVNGNEVALSVKEFELLCYLLENEGIALSRDMILNHVWDYDYFGDARTIDTHVKKLRAKLGDCGKYIKTIWGYGYKFEVNESDENE